MKRICRLTALVLALATLAVMSACAAEEKPSDVVLDCEKSIDELLALGAFDDEMIKSDGAYIDTRMGTADSAESSVSYIAASGATAEMLVIFTCADAEKCKAVEKICGEFVETQKADFATYNPDEVPKLENAVIVNHGKYVLFCVAKDSSAIKTAFDGYFAK